MVNIKVLGTYHEDDPILWIQFHQTSLLILTISECQQLRAIYFTLHWILIPWTNMKHCQTLTDTATQSAKVYWKFKTKKKKKRWINKFNAHWANWNTWWASSVHHFTSSWTTLPLCSTKKRRFWKMKFLLLLVLTCLVSAAEEPLLVHGWALRKLCRKIGGCVEFINVWADYQGYSVNVLVPL